MKHVFAAISAGWLVSIINARNTPINQAETQPEIKKMALKICGGIFTPFLVLTAGVILEHYLFANSEVGGWIIIVVASLSFIPFLLPPFRLRNVLIVLSLIPCFSVGFTAVRLKRQQRQLIFGVGGFRDARIIRKQLQYKGFLKKGDAQNL